MNYIIMKKITTLIILLLAVVAISAQDISGTWTGAMEIPQGQIRFNFNISQTDDGYISTMDSPDQNALGLAVDTTIFKKPELTIKAAQWNIEYVGKLQDDTNIKGTFTQHGQALELNLKKKTQ
jgi:hypothetical protein